MVFKPANLPAAMSASSPEPGGTKRKAESPRYLALLQRMSPESLQDYLICLEKAKVYREATEKQAADDIEAIRRRTLSPNSRKRLVERMFKGTSKEFLFLLVAYLVVLVETVVNGSQIIHLLRKAPKKSCGDRPDPVLLSFQITVKLLVRSGGVEAGAQLS